MNGAMLTFPYEVRKSGDMPKLFDDFLVADGNVFWDMIRCSVVETYCPLFRVAYCCTLKRVAARPFETSVNIYQTA
jgi:hypothetical protein